MKFNELLEKYFLFLWETFMYDVEVFFTLKWIVILLPFYWPFVFIARMWDYYLSSKPKK